MIFYQSIKDKVKLNPNYKLSEQESYIFLQNKQVDFDLNTKEKEEEPATQQIDEMQMYKIQRINRINDPYNYSDVTSSDSNESTASLNKDILEKHPLDSSFSNTLSNTSDSKSSNDELNCSSNQAEALADLLKQFQPDDDNNSPLQNLDSQRSY